jgi:hypothetical protein
MIGGMFLARDRREVNGETYEYSTVGVSGPLWEEVDLSGCEWSGYVILAKVYFALSLWRRLGLDELLAGLIEPRREAV